MSAESIARWQSIPLVRPTDTRKRSRPPTDNDSESEDNVSLVSRTPSPAPQAAGKEEDVHYYDPGYAHEVVTIETKIKETNLGYAMLAKMGWKEGEGLGASGSGRPDPIPFSVKRDGLGLGKATQDAEMAEITVAQRRELDSERMIKETADERAARENKVAQKEAIKSELTETLRSFYCALCDKQYKNVAQYDEHTNGYAHAHRARLKDLQASAKLGREDSSKRKEKEQKREERELRKLAAAAGIKLAKPTNAAAASNPISETTPTPSGGSKGFKKAGWATVSSASPSPVPAEAATTPRWASVESAQASQPSSGGWSRVGQTDAPSSSLASSSSAPAFRNAGWTTLPTASSQPPTPPPPAHDPPPPPPPAPSTSGGWSSSPAPPPPPPSDPPPPPPPAPDSDNWTPPPPSSREWTQPPPPRSPPRQYNRPPSPMDYEPAYNRPPSPPRHHRPPSPPRFSRPPSPPRHRSQFAPSPSPHLQQYSHRQPSPPRYNDQSRRDYSMNGGREASYPRGHNDRDYGRRPPSPRYDDYNRRRFDDDRSRVPDHTQGRR